MIEARAETRHDEADRAPEPHAAIVQRARCGCRSTATVSISGMIVVQLMASRTVASSIGQKPSAAQSSRNESSEPQASPMRIVRRSPSRSAAKLMAGVNRMRVKSGGGQQHGDLVGIEVPPMQPDRQIGQIAADHEEQRRIEKAEPPGEGEARRAAGLAGSPWRLTNPEAFADYSRPSTPNHASLATHAGTRPRRH